MPQYPYPRRHGRKRYYKRRRRRYRPRKRNFIHSIANAAFTGARIAKKLADVVNVEYKRMEGSMVNTSVPQSGYVFPISDQIVQGDADTSRDGDSLKNQRLTMRIRGTNKGSSFNNLRFIILVDKQARSVSDPGWSLSDWFTHVGGPNATLSAKLYDNRFQTKILMDRTIYVNNNDFVTKEFHVNLPLNFHTQYVSGTTTVSTNRLMLIAISDAATNIPEFNAVWGLTFTDN